MSTTPEDTLQAWLAREAEVRATLLPPGVASMDEIRQRTGLELLQGLMTGGIPSREVRQAYKDVTRGLTDTDKGPPMHRAYQQQKK